MKNFSDLQAIDSWLDIEIKTDTQTIYIRWPLLVNLDLGCKNPRSVLVDRMEVISFGYQRGDLWCITLHEPFYQWQHQVTGQGWLLKPHKTP